MSSSKFEAIIGSINLASSNLRMFLARLNLYLDNPFPEGAGVIKQYEASKKYTLDLTEIINFQEFHEILEALKGSNLSASIEVHRKMSFEEISLITNLMNYARESRFKASKSIDRIFTVRSLDFRDAEFDDLDLMFLLHGLNPIYPYGILSTITDLSLANHKMHPDSMIYLLDFLTKNVNPYFSEMGEPRIEMVDGIVFPRFSPTIRSLDISTSNVYEVEAKRAIQDSVQGIFESNWVFASICIAGLMVEETSVMTRNGSLASGVVDEMTSIMGDAIITTEV
ncbi:MAG UNVERIFIED_CONTAM: hypothetical protein LVQ98_04995 [Rickettsiaceae bacterium]|jgi:hypothetical protein